MPHIHDKIDFTVEVFIVYKNKVLLRLHDKYMFWLSVGGHIELDEDPVKAALREVEEEVGLKVELYKPEQYKEFKAENYEELIPPVFMNIHKINESHKHITLTYFAISKSDKITEGVESEKSGGLRWFAEEDLDDPRFNVRDVIKMYAKKALEVMGE